MKKVVFIMFASIMIARLSFGSAAVVPYSIIDAINKKLIKVTVSGRGYTNDNSSSYWGKCINLHIKNLTYGKIEIKMESGRKLKCVYDSIQDMIITKTEMISLSPNESSDFTIYAMCGELRNSVPSTSSFFKFGSVVDGQLLKVVKMIEELDVQNDAGQAAVWVFTDNMSPDNIKTYSGDKERAKKLQEFVYLLKGIDKKEPGYIYDYSYPKTDSVFTNIQGEIQWVMNAPAKVSFILYDNYGNKILTIFENFDFGKGLQSYRYILPNLSLAKGELYWLRLKSAGVKIKEISIQTDP
jgi:hypothetical protein